MNLLVPDLMERVIEEFRARLEDAGVIVGYRRDGQPIPGIRGGAFTTSGLYVATFLDIFDVTQETIDLSQTSHKWALYTNTLTPNYSTDASYSSTNEITGTGYTAGGKDLTGLAPTITESPSTVLKYAHSAISWTVATFSGVRGGILYADAQTTPVADPLIVGLSFGADFGVTSGTFTVTPNASGVFAIDLY